jgi:hypothetical protein
LTAVSAAGLLVGFGLCGTGTLFKEGVMDVFFVAGSAAFWTSALGMLVSLVWWVIRELIRDSRRRR